MYSYTSTIHHGVIRRAVRRFHPLTALKRFNSTSSTATVGETVSNGNALASNHNKLFKQIQARILTGGPITVADYMKEVLTNPVGGYYMNRDVFGKEGDFVTSPEISQMFGELVAIWFINEWMKCGQPKPLQIAELGPGRGTLMSDILRVFAKFKLLEPSQLSVCLVEVSPHLSRVQEDKICGKVAPTKLHEAIQTSEPSHYKESLAIRPECVVRWYRHLQDIPRAFTLFLAHEFFDALPVHKLVQVENQAWREVLVDLDPAHFGRLRYVLSRERTPACLYRHEQDMRKELEVSPQSLVIIQEMATRIHQYGGIGLIADYGHEGDKTDTFRAFRNHQLHDPLVNPGTADLTADVDFAALKRAVCRPAEKEDDWKPVLAYGTIDQASFLSKMGIQVRLKQLLATCDKETAAQLTSAHRMLTDPAGMGSRFKLLSLFPAVMEPILKRYPPHGFV